MDMLHKLELFMPICHGNHNSAVWGEKGSNLSAMTTFEWSGQTGKNDLRWRRADQRLA